METFEEDSIEQFTSPRRQSEQNSSPQSPQGPQTPPNSEENERGVLETSL